MLLLLTKLPQVCYCWSALLKGLSLCSLEQCYKVRVAAALESVYLSAARQLVALLLTMSASCTSSSSNSDSSGAKAQIADMYMCKACRSPLLLS
jgi:hypothetical protein